MYDVLKQIPLPYPPPAVAGTARRVSLMRYPAHLALPLGDSEAVTP